MESVSMNVAIVNDPYILIVNTRNVMWWIRNDDDNSEMFKFK